MDPTSLFGLGISGLTFGIICISVLCPLVLTAAIIGGVIYFNRKNREKAENLMAKGTQGEATILSLEDTGMLVNNNPRVKITMEVRMSMYPTYQITKTVTVPLIRLPQVQTGSVVQVMVDMSDPTNPDKVGLLLK